MSRSQDLLLSRYLLNMLPLQLLQLLQEFQAVATFGMRESNTQCMMIGDYQILHLQAVQQVPVFVVVPVQEQLEALGPDVSQDLVRVLDWRASLPKHLPQPLQPSISGNEGRPSIKEFVRT